MSIEISNESGMDVSEEDLLDVARFVIARMDVHPAAELSMVLVDLDTMADLHVRWMDLPGPTDVMSFPMDELEPGGRPDAPEAVLSWFVRRRPLLNGLVGPTFGSMLAFFRKRGYTVITAFRKNNFDRLARESDVCVMFYFWRRGCRVGAHYVALQHTPEGFVGYNTFRNSTGPDRYGDSLSSFLKARHGALPALIALKKV